MTGPGSSAPNGSGVDARESNDGGGECFASEQYEAMEALGIHD